MSRELLLVPMQENDAGAATVGGYLQALLSKLWQEEEGFSGKRPFGNSGWADELYRPLIAAGKVEGGKLDEDGRALERGEADDVVFEAIEALFTEPAATEEAHRIAAMVLRAEADRLDPAE